VQGYRRNNVEKLKVSLDVAWLSENGLLEPAAKLLGYAVIPGTHTQEGIQLLEGGGKTFTINWTSYSFQFTVAQLLALGFDPGVFEYCPCCKKLKVECDVEMDTIYARLDEEI
jgi:hypothetical protein